VPSVCSNLSGCGAFVQSRVPDHDENGVFIVDRREANPDASIGQLTEILHRFTRFSRRERIQLRNRTERLSELFDWGNLYAAYNEAHEQAIQHAFG